MPDFDAMIVLGAGVSKEVHMPLGSELTEIIATNLDIWYEDTLVRGNRIVAQTIKIIQSQNLDLGRDAVFLACRLISEAMPLAESIDNFLHNHRQKPLIAECGKLGIAISILEAEKRSLLYSESDYNLNGIDSKKISKTAYNKIFQKLAKGKTAKQFSQILNKVLFINFNYDRCLEQFAYYWVQKYYGISPHDAPNLLEDLSVFRPYGSLGKLPWQTPNNSLRFGSNIVPHELINVSKRIRTFTEGSLLTKGSQSDVQNCLNSATLRLYLGFAFHPMNMSLLECNGYDLAPNDCISIATAYGMSKNNIEIIDNALDSTVQELASLKKYIESNMKAGEIFDAYSLMIEEAFP